MKRLVTFVTVSFVATLAVISCGGGGGETPPIPAGQEVGPAGGTLTFANGVKLVFPAGAVDARTVITVDDLPAAQIDAILSNPAMSTQRAKRFLGGFSAKPDGLSFKAPVQAWVPVLPLDAYEIPIPLAVRLNEGTYHYKSSSLEYDGALNMVKLELQHFSDEIFAGLSGKQIDALCTACGTFDSAVCEALDPLQPACCLLPPVERKPPDAGKPGENPRCAHAADCECCREKDMHVTSVDIEFTCGGCQIIGADLAVYFPSCSGKPTEWHKVHDTDCMDLNVQLSIEPPVMDLPINQVRTLAATVSGTRGNQTVCERVPVFPVWKSDEPSVADFVDQNGNIRGNAISLAPITVRASAGEGKGFETTALVNVVCEGCALDIKAAKTHLTIGESLSLTALVRDSQGAEVDVPPVTLSWASSDTKVASLVETSGPSVTLQALARGTTVITATYEDVGAKHSASLEITVGAIIDLGTLEGHTYSDATDINNLGQVVGRSHLSGAYSDTRAFLYSDGTMTGLGSLNNPDRGSEPMAINDSGQIVGCSTVWKQGWISDAPHAFLYSGGMMTDLGTFLPSSPDHVAWYSDTCARGINSRGQIVGGSNVQLSGAPVLYGSHAFLYSGGVMTDLGTLIPSGNASLESDAVDINDNGEIVGSSQIDFYFRHAFLYSNGVMTDLGSLSDQQSWGAAINASAQIVGWSQVAGGVYHGFLYSGGVMTDLGTLAGRNTWALDINASGQIVGTSQMANGDYHAYLFSDGVMTDLNALIDPDSGWTLNQAAAINDLGQIVGWGAHDGKTHAFLLQ